MTLYFLWFNVSRLIFDTLCIQYFKTIIYFNWFNVSRPSISHTHKNSLHFHSSFSLLLLYIHMSIAFHIILSQIHLEKNEASTFQWHHITPTLQYHLIVTRISGLWLRKGACVFYSMTIAYGFDVELIHCRFCEGYDLLGVFGCLRFWIGKVINVFYFRTKEKEKETF